MNFVKTHEQGDSFGWRFVNGKNSNNWYGGLEEGGSSKEGEQLKGVGGDFIPIFKTPDEIKSMAVRRMGNCVDININMGLYGGQEISHLK